jgi:hypothetical protein
MLKSFNVRAEGGGMGSNCLGCRRLYLYTKQLEGKVMGVEEME